jgi:hypothetical protein
MVKNPRFTLVEAGSLALGASSAVFSLADARGQSASRRVWAAGRLRRAK